MDLIVKIVLFLLGMCFCVQLMAALYGIVDLRYTMRTAYPTVIRRILAWTLLCTVVAWLLRDDLRPAFLWGLVAYVGFYLFSFWGYQLLFQRNVRLLGIRHPLKKGQGSDVPGVPEVSVPTNYHLSQKSATMNGAHRADDD